MDDPSPDTPHPDPTTQEDPRSLDGRMLGGFRVLRMLGQGGMGIVYEAEQQVPRRAVALKVIRGGAFVDEGQVKLFQREAQTLARLKHPAIATIYEQGRTEDGQHFFAMELVRGATLADWLRRQPFDLRARLGLFGKLCEAVAYAHQRGVIHRDLKPSNVLVLNEPVSGSSAGGVGVPDIKILDFGLARITDADLAASSVLTDVGTIRGTLPYMSPEQLRGNPDEIDLRTDVYSLGVLLYEMLTGRLPHDLKGLALAEAARVICAEPPAPLTASPGGTARVDADVATVVQKAMAKEPARRYQSAAALAEDVQRYLADQPILARPPSAAYQFRKLVARHKAAFGFIAALFVMAATLAVAMTVQAARIARERDRANQEAQAARHVSAFLTGLFEVADPNEARGSTVTAREILDRGSEKISRDLAEQPLVQAQLLDTMGNVYRSLGLYEQAGSLLERAHRTRERLLGPEHPATIETLVGISRLHFCTGRIEEGMASADRAVAAAEAALGPDDVRLGSGLYWRGVHLHRQGRHADARLSFERAESIFERALGPNALEVAWCLNDLGNIQMAQGDLDEGLRSYEQALRIKEQGLPPEHIDLAGALNNVGWALSQRGDLARARPLLEQAHAIANKTLGPDHPFTSVFLHSLGELLYRMGEHREAATRLERALSIQEAALALDDPELARTLNTLALVHAALGDSERAEAGFRRALTLREKRLPAGDPAIAETLEGYAALLRTSGRGAEAERLEARAMAVRGAAR